MNKRMKLAKELRNTIDSNVRATRSMIRIDDMEDGELEGIISLYDKWEIFIGENISKDKIVQYEGNLYKVLKDHKVEETYNPVDANYLFTKIIAKGVIAEWEQRDYTNPYMIGDKVIWKDDVYVCIKDKTSHNPTDAPQNWELEVKE